MKSIDDYRLAGEIMFVELVDVHDYAPSDPLGDIAVGVVRALAEQGVLESRDAADVNEDTLRVLGRAVTLAQACCEYGAAHQLATVATEELLDNRVMSSPRVVAPDKTRTIELTRKAALAAYVNQVVATRAADRFQAAYDAAVDTERQGMRV